MLAMISENLLVVLVISFETRSRSAIASCLKSGDKEFGPS